MRRQALLCLAVCVLWGVAAEAQDPGDRTFTALGGGSIGQAGVGASGDIGVSLPLHLPAPRGNLPLPFRVSFTGSSIVGAAGVGWEIPIPGVTRQRNLSRRKPVHRLMTVGEPAPADRVFVDTGAGPALMAPTETPGSFQPFANGYYELTCSATSCIGRDAEGRRWTFERLIALADDDFFALVRIEDASGVNRLELHYDVFDRFSPEPIAAVDPALISARELTLREIHYAHDAGGACPKYRIRLGYSVSPAPLALEFIRGRPRTRSRLLQTIELVTSADPGCTALRQEATYRIGYLTDPVTGQPRLETVDMLAPPDGATPAPAIPVVRYKYGSPAQNGELRFAETEHILLPAGPNGANRGFAATVGKGGGSIYGHVRGFHDLNGDGRADFLTLNAQGKKPLLAINRPSALGNDFSTFPSELPLPNTPAAPYNLGTPDLSFGLPVVAAIDNTYQQLIDFNGDGRPDIVVATGGRNARNKPDPNFWMVLVNQPGPSGPGDIVWLERHIDVSDLRAAVMQGHRLSPVASSDRNAKPLPLERTHQSGLFGGNTVLESGVITQWKLLDVNGDGFPDFVFDSDGITAVTEQRCDPDGVCHEAVRQDHAPGNRLLVFYHTGPMMAGSGNGPQAAWRGPPVLLREDGACGVTRFSFAGGGIRTMTCGFLEADGDGLVDYVATSPEGTRVIRSPGLAQVHDVLLPENHQPVDYAEHERKRTIALPGAVGMVRDPRADACPSGASGSKTYEIELLSDLRDVTGDGIADYVFFGGQRLPPGNPEGPQGWWYMAGTGTGYVAARPIRGPDAVPFALHLSVERCDGTFSNTIASLLDLDGDGRPEIVRSPNVMNVRVAKLSGPDGALGAHDAGLVTAIDNRFGSVSQIRYGSAKSGWLSRQHVPYPQIVVAETQQTAAFNLGTSLAPVRFAYGEGEQLYHPLLGRFVFRGYARRVELRGEPGSAFDTLKGTAEITTAIRAAEVPDARERLMLAGQPREIRVLAGTIPADPRHLLGSGGLPPLAEHTAFRWKTRALPGAVPPLVPLDEECYGTPSPPTPGVFGDLALCRRRATAFLASRATSEGPRVFPHPENVATRTEVTEVDAFARPVKIRLDGDRRRTQDDLCLELSYAAPVPGASLILEVPASVRARECATQRILAAMHLEYDDLPAGQVRLGRANRRVLERRNAATGQLLEQVPSATLLRDVFGNPIEVVRTRADGATATVRITYDPFGLMPVRGETTATGLATPLVTTIERDPHSLLPLMTAGPTGAAFHPVYDPFGRLQRMNVTLPGDPQRYVVLDIVRSGFDGAPTGRSVRYTAFHDLVPEHLASTPPPGSFVTSTAVLDEFARQMHRIVELGPDYGGRSLIVDEVRYDGLGRPRFASDPFPATAFGPRYGTTFTYRADGRPECTIDGTGEQTAIVTDESLDRYPACVSYLYRDGQLVVRRRGPNEMAGGRPQSGAHDEDVYSATGQLLSRSRVKRDVVLERAEYGYDRLGNAASVTRWARPGQSSTRAVWRWVSDSLGNVLEASEPRGVKRRFSYDTFGQLTAVEWRDSTGFVPVDRAQRLAYDGLSRPVRIVEEQNGAELPETVREFVYDVPSGQPHHLDTAFLAGRLSAARGGGREMLLGYDALGRLTALTRAEGADRFAERRTFDADGAVRTVQFFAPGSSQPPDVVRYAYDSARQLRTVSHQDATGLSELWRVLDTDLFGRVLRARSGNGTVTRFTYRSSGRRQLEEKRVDTSGGSRVLQLKGFDGGTLLRGTAEQSTLSGVPSVTTALSYDARNALARSVVQSPTGVLTDLRYSYDGLGNLTAIVDAIGGGSMVIRPDPFDPDRICSVAPPSAPPGPCTYHYDGAGNVRAVAGGATFDYDAAGRLRSAQAGPATAGLEYGPLGSLARLRVGDGQIERRERFFGAVTQVGFFDGAGAPVTVGAPGTTFQRYTELRIDSPVGEVGAIRRADTGHRVVLYPIGEAAGTRLVLDEAGAAAQAIAYDAYGNVTAQSGEPESLSFWTRQWNGGHSLGDLRLTALGERVLDSRTGRFLQRDPVIDPAGAAIAHPYAFALNNPATFVDYDGAEPAARGDLGVSDLASALGGFLAADGEPGPTTDPDPYIDLSFACDYDHDCMGAIEQATGSLTGFEQQLRELHVSRAGRGPKGVKSYHVIKDRLSGAVYGYALSSFHLYLYDRSGTLLRVIGGDEPPLKEPLLSPVDFVAGGLTGLIRGVSTRQVVRQATQAVERKVVAQAAPGAPFRAYVLPQPARFPLNRPLPQFQYLPANHPLLGGSPAATLSTGEIFIASWIQPGGFYQGLFVHVLRHEGMHSFLSPRGGIFSVARARAKGFFYKHSTLLRYTEEVLAERAATGDWLWALRFPFRAPIYRMNAFRLAGEAVGAGAFYYGSYKLGSFLGESDD
jgi:RHS repeat-associated protein